MKTRIVLLLTLFLICSLPACTTQATPEYVPEGAERDSIVADTDVFIQEIVTGIKDKEYAVFATHFDDVMLASIKAGDFDKISATYSLLGEPSSVELINVQVAGEYYAVRYKVTYVEKIVIVRVVVDDGNPRKVSGLWFE